MDKLFTREYTLGNLVGRVLGIDNPEEAAQFFTDYVEHLKNNASVKKGHYSAVELARANIGWVFGEGLSQERINMWAPSL